MKKNFPPYLNQAWFARKMYPHLSSQAAQVILSRKLSGKRSWDDGEEKKLLGLFASVAVSIYPDEYLDK